MRRKIKEIMNKEEGFTLVELLAVIVILGIILAIAIPSIGGVMDKAQNNANEAEQELVVDAARMYFVAEGDGKVTAGKKVTVTQLNAEGYLDKRSKEDAIKPATVTVKADETNSKILTYEYTAGE